MKRPGLPMRATAILLAVAMFYSSADTLWGQSAASPVRLQITILDGEGALNNIKLRTAREPIVRVEDENHKPVAGAAVIFLLPDSGPGGTFLDGTTTFSTTTDAEGKAVASGLKPNNVAGQYQMRVRAKHGEDEAEITITQVNVLGTGTSGTAVAHSLPVKWIIIGIAVAGGAAAGIVASQGGNSSTTITPGTPTVGAPGVRRVTR